MIESVDLNSAMNLKKLKTFVTFKSLRFFDTLNFFFNWLKMQIFKSTLEIQNVKKYVKSTLEIQNVKSTLKVQR